MGLVDVTNPQVLLHVGNNLYDIDPNALAEGQGEEDLLFMLNDDANINETAAEGKARILQGFLETSNVDMVKSMTDLMISQRGLQLNARAIGLSDEMMGIANRIIR